MTEIEEQNNWPVMDLGRSAPDGDEAASANGPQHVWKLLLEQIKGFLLGCIKHLTRAFILDKIFPSNVCPFQRKCLHVCTDRISDARLRQR